MSKSCLNNLQNVVYVLPKYLIDITQILSKFCPNVSEKLFKYCPDIVQNNVYQVACNGLFYRKRSFIWPRLISWSNSSLTFSLKVKYFLASKIFKDFPQIVWIVNTSKCNGWVSVASSKLGVTTPSPTASSKLLLRIWARYAVNTKWNLLCDNYYLNLLCDKHYLNLLIW